MNFTSRFVQFPNELLVLTSHRPWPEKHHYQFALQGRSLKLWFLYLHIKGSIAVTQHSVAARLLLPFWKNSLHHAVPPMASAPWFCQRSPKRFSSCSVTTADWCDCMAQRVVSCNSLKSFQGHVLGRTLIPTS